MAKHISVKGVVEGVGFPQFVYELAIRFGLHGWVCNTSSGVEILVDGPGESLERFIQSLSLEEPRQARIDLLEVREAPSEPCFDFVIRDSLDDACQSLPVDVAICPDCERELFDPKDRRYLYPFINCACCGPRFTIIRDLPYNRSGTTMSEFTMCEYCQDQYVDPLDRHFHDQPIACPNCGPFVELRETHSQFPTTDPRISSIEIRTSAILKARRLLREGYIVAVKGLGGFHLACDASNPYTVAELRDRKRGVEKPFAVMVSNLTAAASICEMSRDEQRLLASREKPVVLLAKKGPALLQTNRVSELVTPNLDTLGVMLPYTPLHHLLLNQTDPVLSREPVPPILVMTRSNFTDEPIATENKDALRRLSTLADAFLLHNREIHMRADDSVVRVEKKGTIYLRRARGYAPYPVKLPFEARPTLAVGGDLKNTFCLAREDDAFISHHIGEMGNVETDAWFEQSIRHLSQILHFKPEIIGYDLHPDYFTTRYAHRSDLQQIGVQHHHAHLVSCMLDNGLDDHRLIGLSFDGTGFGLDGMDWGGEVMIVSFANFERFAHLQYLPLPDSDTGIPAPWRIAVSYAQFLGIEIEDLPFLRRIDKQPLQVLRRRISGVPDGLLTSSMGRLFDAAASLIGVRNEITYEDQLTIEMEMLSRPFLQAAKPYSYILVETEQGKILRVDRVIQSMVEDVRAGKPVGQIGANFHKTIAGVSIEICRRAHDATGLKEVLLSGGVWENQTLLDLVRDGLQQDGFTVYSHSQVPTHDGGLSLGQAVIANCLAAGQGSPQRVEALSRAR